MGSIPQWGQMDPRSWTSMHRAAGWHPGPGEGCSQVPCVQPASAPPCPAARPQPPGKPSVRQEDVGARRVLLSWESGGDGLSPVRYYTVQMRELPAGRWTLHSASVSHNASAFLVDR